MAVGTNIVYSPEVYAGRIGFQHVPAMEVHMGEAAEAMTKERLKEDFDSTPDEFNLSLNGLHNWGKTVCDSLPAGVDLALDVDDGGFTRRRYEPRMFSSWTESEVAGVFLRFAEARTATHGISMLRTPIMAGGIALESTCEPESDDIRKAHTMYVVEPRRGEDANYPWVVAHPARLFDMSEFTPFFAGPLYNGHPNEVTSEVRQQQVVELGLGVFEKLIS